MILEAAIAQVVLKLAALRIAIVDEQTNKPMFVRVPSIKLSHHLEWLRLSSRGSEEYEEALLKVISNQHLQLWPDIDRQPPWKVIAVEDDTKQADQLTLDIIFATHHSICDGTSTAVFHICLLESLNFGSTEMPGLQDGILHLPGPVDLLPAQEDLIKFTVSWSFLLRTLWEELAPSWLRGQPPVVPWTSNTVSFEPHQLQLRLITLAETTVSKLLAACRIHNTTLTPLIHAMILTSLAQRLTQSEASKFASQTPIGLRQYATLPPGCEVDLSKELVDLCTSQRHEFGLDTVAEIRRLTEQDTTESDDAVWKIAADLRVSMKTRLDTLPRDDMVSLLAWLPNLHQWFLAKQGKARSESWEVSNLGAFAGTNTATSCRIERSIFSQFAAICGAAFTANVAGIHGGPVTISFTWQDSVTDMLLMDHLVSDLRKWFTHFGQTGRFGFFTNAS